MKRLTNLLVGALSGIVIASCGGGSGSNSVAEGGIGGTGISSGSISAFSSIVVNGTKFDVDAAEITVNSNPNATQDALEIGYVVRVDGDLHDGVAESVRFEANLIGEVDANGIPDGEAVGALTVMRQDVEITATTVITGTEAPDTIKDQLNDADPDRVLVSGYRDSSETIVATHLAVNPTDSDQILGEVDTSGSGSFTINGLVVNTPEEPEPGDVVLVRGDYNPVTMEFTPAFPLEQLAALVSAGTEIELEGIVDRFVDTSDFDVNGVTVDASSPTATIVDETGAPATIQPNAEVEVEGFFDSGGTLIADRVEVELEDNVEIIARVANDPGAGGPVDFFIFGTPLLTVAVTNKTELRDKSDTPVNNFSVADLAMDDWVELDAFEDGTGNVTALKIERFTPDVDEWVVVEGPLDSKSGPIVEVLGMTFDASGLGFDFDTIDPGDTVEVEWDPARPFEQPDMRVDGIEKED